MHGRGQGGLQQVSSCDCHCRHQVSKELQRVRGRRGGQGSWPAQARAVLDVGSGHTREAQADLLALPCPHESAQAGKGGLNAARGRLSTQVQQGTRTKAPRKHAADAVQLSVGPREPDEVVGHVGSLAGPWHSTKLARADRRVGSRPASRPVPEPVVPVLCMGGAL